jgi:hypothetical protein
MLTVSLDGTIRVVALPKVKSVKPKTPAQVRAYKDDLCKVYKHWGGKPKGALKKWFGC